MRMLAGWADGQGCIEAVKKSMAQYFSQFTKLYHFDDERNTNLRSS